MCVWKPKQQFVICCCAFHKKGPMEEPANTRTLSDSAVVLRVFWSMKCISLTVYCIRNLCHIIKLGGK